MVDYLIRRVDHHHLVLADLDLQVLRDNRKGMLTFPSNLFKEGLR